jgi:hypothetical protein
MRKARIAWIESLPESCWKDLRESLTESTEFQSFVSLTDLHASESAPGFDVIAVVCAFPDQYSLSKIAQLRFSVPLAGIILLLGPWSEGAPRTARACPGVVTKRWHEARVWFEAQLARWNQSRCPEWYGDFVHAADFVRDTPSQDKVPSPRVGILTAHQTLSESLVCMLTNLGYEAVAIPWPPNPAPEVDIYLWDETAWMGQSAPDLRKVVLTLPPAPLIVLANVLRPAEMNQWKMSGVRDVLGKPFTADQLAAAIQKRDEEKD